MYVDIASTTVRIVSMDVRETLAENVRTNRKRLALSQEDLAEAAGLHRTYVSGIERGVRNPSIAIVARLANALRTNPGDLLTSHQGR